MTGTLLIAIGAVLIALGIVFHFKYKKPSRENLSEDPDTNQETESNQEEAGEFDPEFLNMIDMAVADGVLTDNEKTLIVKRAMELQMDIDEVEKYVNREIKKKTGMEETKLIDVLKEAGNTFEKFIVTRFNPNYFKIKEWAGDKYIQGIYAESTINPDLVIRFQFEKTEQLFAVECKYRSKYKMGGVIWAKESQIKNYLAFQEKANMPVFVAIGVGGDPGNPGDLYVVPLNEIGEDTFIPSKTLNKFRKNNFREKHFYFDVSSVILA